MSYLKNNPKDIIDELFEAKVIKVPNLKTNSQALKFISNLPASATVNSHIINPESGELYMSPGDTKIKLARNKAKDRIDPREVIIDIKDVENYYNIVKKSIRTIIDTSRVDPDVDIDSIIPVFFSRTDLGKLQTYDMENIEEYLDDYKEEAGLQGIKFILSPSGKRIKIDITFI